MMDGDTTEPKLIASRILRGVVIVAGLVAAGTSSVAAFSAALRGPQAGLGMMTGWAPGDTYAAAGRALFASSPRNPPARKMIELGRAGLGQSPLSASSLAMIGFAQEAIGERDDARRTFLVANRMTRRDLMTHLWLASDAARANDVPGALREYDLAMRTSQSAPTVMVPLMAQAISDDNIALGLATLFAQRPPWLLIAADNLTVLTPHPEQLAMVFEKAGGLPAGTQYHIIEGRLLDRLLEKGAYEAAVSFYSSLNGTREADLREIQFGGATVSDARGKLAWRGVDTPSASGSFVKRGGGIVLEGSAGPSDRGPIAERVTFLRAGNYTINGQVQVDGEPDAGVVLEIACMSGSAKGILWKMPLGRGPRSVSLPADCGPQQLAIVLESGRGALGAQATVTKLSVGPR